MPQPELRLPSVPAAAPTPGPPVPSRPAAAGPAPSTAAAAPSTPDHPASGRPAPGHPAPGQPGVGTSASAPATAAAPPPAPPGGNPLDAHHRAVGKRLESIRARSEKASCWRSLSQYVTRLVNRDGFVPLRVRLSRADVAFLANARSDLMSFAGLGIRLVEMHRPREAGGISSDPANPIRRCRACMWRWPCPTFQALDEAVHHSGRLAG